MGIGKNISALLEKRGITVAQLSRETGIAATTVYSIIQRDSDSVTISTLQKVCDALDVEIWEIIGVDRETARQNKNTLEDFGDMYADDDERKSHEFQKKVYEQEEKIMIDYYYNSIVPTLKALGYKSNYFVYNSEHSIVLEKNGKEWEISYKDAKEAVSDSLYLADHLLNKHLNKIRKITKERMQYVHDSSNKTESKKRLNNE